MTTPVDAHAADLTAATKFKGAFMDGLTGDPQTPELMDAIAAALTSVEFICVWTYVDAQGVGGGTRHLVRTITGDKPGEWHHISDSFMSMLHNGDSFVGEPSSLLDPEEPYDDQDPLTCTHVSGVNYALIDQRDEDETGTSTISPTATPTAVGTSETLMVWEMPDRYDLIGLDVVNRVTHEAESFIAFSRDEIDFVGLVESREKSYADTDWYTRRVYRTTVRPTTVKAAFAAAGEYIALIEGIHRVYRHIVMDTPKDRDLHDRHVANADNALRLVKERLDSIT